MHLLPILALSGNPGGSAFDEMLRLIGIAAIVFAFFKGIKSLITKPASPVAAPQQQSAPVPAPVAAKPVEQAPVATKAQEPAPAPAAQDDAIAPEIIAAIAAAVACFIGPSHRIVSIKRQSTTWERAGRQSVLTSHRIR